MQRVLFTWELGANFGHLSRLIPLAQEQRALGREVLFAVNNLQVSKHLLDSIGFVCVLAPKVIYKSHRRLAANHTELLLNCGYSNQEGLQQTVGEWLTLFERYQPSLLVIDHSPTALLANKISKIPVIQVGSGFEIPPSDGWPNYSSIFESHKNEVLQLQLNQIPITLLNNMNCAIKQYGGDEMQSSCELYNACEQILLTFKELDHYPSRKQAEYVGPISATCVGQQVYWSQDTRKKIYVYAWPALPGLNQMFVALSQIDAEVIAVIPSLAENVRQTLKAPNIRIYTSTISLGNIIEHTDLLITHGFGTLSVFLQHGVPILMIPHTIEQFLLGIRVNDHAIGLAMAFRLSTINFKTNIEKLLNEFGYRQAALTIAKRYKDYKAEDALKKINETIEMLL